MLSIFLIPRSLRRPRGLFFAVVSAVLGAGGCDGLTNGTVDDPPGTPREASTGTQSQNQNQNQNRPDAGSGQGGSSITTNTPEAGSFSGPPETSTRPADMRGPTPARAGVKFPFPQNRELSPCVYPSSYRNDDVTAAYQKWKSDTVTSNGAGGHLRVQRHETDTGLALHSTVSEGIGYGMIIAVYMNDQNLFDELWKYEQMWLGENGLMDWYINAEGNNRLGTGAATDADEDMAWALIQADKQWGGQGTLGKSYIDVAKDLIGKIWNHEIFESKALRAGDKWGDWTNLNISYFAPAYYRVFAKVTGDNKWMQVVSTSYDVIEKALNSANGNQSNGLVPAWCTSDGAPNAKAWQEGNAPTNYQYDSCRTPFRIGLDWCMFSEPRAKSYVAKTSTFFSGVGVSNIADTYELNGTPKPSHPGKGSAAFIGPAGVGAMSDRTYQKFVDDSYTAVATNMLMAGGNYYEDSWTVLSLLMMSGNFVDYTKL